MSQNYSRLGQSDELCRLSRRVRQHQRHGRRIAHVLRRADHYPSSDEIDIFAAVDELGKIKNRRVGIGAAHALYQRADQIVMIIALLIEQLNAFADNLFERLDGDPIIEGGGLFEEIERHSGVAVGDVGNYFD